MYKRLSEKVAEVARLPGKWLKNPEVWRLTLRFFHFSDSL
jgi:hypothetical protein